MEGVDEGRSENRNFLSLLASNTLMRKGGVKKSVATRLLPFGSNTLCKAWRMRTPIRKWRPSLKRSRASSQQSSTMLVVTCYDIVLQGAVKKIEVSTISLTISYCSLNTALAWSFLRSEQLTNKARLGCMRQLAFCSIRECTARAAACG